MNHNQVGTIQFILIKTCLIIVLFSNGFLEVKCQGVPSGGGDGGSSSALGEKNFAFLPIPYINYNRSLGLGIGALPMAMYKVNPKDSVSPASISGLFGMYTTNDTWFAMFFQQLYLNQDNWRITLAGGLASVNFQFFIETPISRYLDYNTAANFAFVELQKKIIPHLYGGFRYMYVDVESTIGDLPQEISPQPQTLQGIGVVTSLDKRDDVYYARNGHLSNLSFMSFPFFLDNLNESNKLELDINKYISLRNNTDVLAFRLYSGIGLGSLAFEQQFIVGQEDIRGYTQGKYRGDKMVAFQSEYRWNFSKRSSLVGFVGFASIFDSFNEDHNGLILPGAGSGYRYNVAPQYHMNVGFDLAVGKDDWGFYFRVGEAF